MDATDPSLARALQAAVLAQDFAATADAWQGGQPLGLHPSIDLAVVVFDPARQQAPRCANVLFSREHPQGLVAALPGNGGALRSVRFDADLQGADGSSIAWAPGSNWQALPFMPLHNLHDPAAPRCVAPYPASLLKLMVAVGVGLAVDRGLCAWPAALQPMMVVSSNDATDDCVALLHHAGLIDPARGHTALNDVFKAYGLPTLQLNRTTPTGGWRNANGAGVGHIHMTAWDTARLLWLLDAQAPPAPWLPAGTAPLLQASTRNHLRAVLAAQQLDEVLSSGRLKNEAGWVPGLPDAPAFAHKTGTTDNYASDAGIVRTGGAQVEDDTPDTHYIVALLSSLGRRFAATPASATTWQLPALGAAIHRINQALP